MVQGSTDARRFVAVYGHQGRTVAAVTFDQAMWLDFWREQIETAAPFPPVQLNVDQPSSRQPVPAGFTHRPVPTESLRTVRTGHSTTEPTARSWR